MYYIVYGDTCITSLRHNGRKIYAHECMYVNFHLQVHACTCMNMNINWWCSYTDSFFISHTVYSLSSSWNILWLYRFCAVCKRYSAKENIHCDVCDSCPTKVRGLQIQAELLYIQVFFSPFFTCKQFHSVLNLSMKLICFKNFRHRKSPSLKFVLW